eukprot:CAMPEP_0119080570 /NCGR_PEP_ID=MMETSP1178-20130426/112599_1 /TAXON_ID=33656 /ORGANISM="unid sp, Strain CCMP2000" /LENGTH=190 /DNA_ID=CAMNT_0007063187 /DNA_START=26 /DNA_END=598 /DNA_ORIENTATION=+
MADAALPAAPNGRAEDATPADATLPAAFNGRAEDATPLSRTPSQQRTLARFNSYPFDSHGNSKFDSWGEKFKVYAALEVGIWLPGLFALCYHCQPAVRFVRTRFGGAFVQSIAKYLRHATPSQYEKIAKLGAKAYGSPKGRTTAEWLLLNKVLSPVSLPAKIFLANWIVDKQSQQLAASAAVSVQATAAR